MLYATPAEEAVVALAGDWSPRAQAAVNRFGLAAAEYAVTLCLIYSGEVGNGGHSQFFLNRGGRIARAALLALDAVGLSQAHDILSRACAVFPNGYVPDTSAEVEAMFDGIDESSLAQLDELDDALSAVPVDEVLLVYLRAHADEILRPERGLDET